MFTGIIEEVANVKQIKKKPQSAEITLTTGMINDDLRLGDSVAVNGVCLTVCAIKGNIITFDMMAETLNRSNLKLLKSGSVVNVERAMKSGGRFGGHIVSGHVDFVSKIVSVEGLDIAKLVTIEIQSQYTNYVVKQGSITIDGVSLTVAKLSDNRCTVSLVPHTQANTNFSNLAIGREVNIEVDIIAKYVEEMVIPNANKEIDRQFLEENGFY